MSLKAKIEAVIYASEDPVTLAQLTGLLGEEAQAELDALAAQQPPLTLETPPATEDEAAPDTQPVAASKPESKRLRDHFRSLLDQLIADYASADRGFELVEVAGGYRLRTKPEFHDTVRGFVKSLKPPLKLSLQALETLAVVAYKQPVTAPEISEIRGVDSAGTLGSLITRKLITTAGRKQVIGRPMLYKTTKDFLLRFGLKDVAELPSIEEFEKMAGELGGDVIEFTSANDTEEDPMSAPRHNIDQETAEETAATGTSAPIAETDSAPEPTHILHETTEDLMADDSSVPEGHRTEP